MTTNQPFQLIAQTLPGLAQPDLAIAAGRAGGLGILDLTYTKLDAAQQAVDRLARYGRAGGGVRLDGSDLHDGELARLALPAEIHTIILSGPADLERVRHFQMDGRRVWLEVTSLARARQGEAWGVDGLVAKGQEAGGWIGEETTFILLQRLVRAVTLPVYAQGGIGLHTIAAVYVAGAAGAILDSQLALLQESRLPNEVKKFVLQMDGSETIQLGSGTGHPCRMVNRPGAQPMEELRRQVAQMGAADGETWQELVGARVGWGHIKEDVWLLGQDAAFAKGFAERFFTVRGVFQALWDSLISHSRQARQLQPLQEGSPLAQSHGTRFPIVQGPMTRVSDRAEFALQIAEGGGLPFLALALMRAPEVEKLLRETQQVLGRRPWGIGILGFVPAELRQEQLEVALRYRPPFAIIAGGRPDQALQLEKAGIQTYLHVPSPGLLELFLQDGARRFIFEGRECGGHIGPRSSFVLWETMVEAILKHLPADADRLHVLFAGGIHDALSASMVATLAAPLAAQGAKVGVLLGTGYLFTQEAVESGAILPNFQQEALSCDHTVTVESGPGHAIRCVDTPFTQEFSLEKRRMLQEARPADEIRETLDRLNIGRLRIAAKGVNRLNGLPEYVRLSEEEQHRQGMFMIGQLAALRQSTCTIAELHQEVALGASRRLAEGDWAGEAAAQANQAGFQTAVPTPQPSRVAIIGIECLLPQADDRQTFWENVLKGVYAITEIPADRWDADLYYDPDPAARDKIYSRWGGFLNDVLFDPLEFGMPPNSLRSIDPMQLLALKVAKAALADAGYANRPFERGRTSVILGASGGTGDLGAKYLLRSSLPLLFGEQAAGLVEQAGDRLPEWTEDSFAGLLLNVAAGRIANRLDLGGLNFVVDAACASSLTAVHLAVRELETQGSDLVIVGGVDTVQNPFGYLCFSKTQALSATGQPRTFDAEADGIAISEGIVMLVLKRLADAERDGDRIYAVIQGSNGSSDGKAKGLTAPRPEGQVLALERAYQKAGIDPTTVGLFEAHGTGTAVGDRTEAVSLGTFLEEAGAQPNSHAVGSVKSMIGHTKASAGVAGLAKVALALYHKVLPPTLGVTTPNPQARFGSGPLYVNSETRPWLHSQAHPRRAGVSAFGFGGTNFHVVVEEYQGDYNGRPAVSQEWESELLLLSGRDRAEIDQTLRQLSQALRQGAQPRLRDLAYTLWQSYRPEAAVHLAIVAESLADLQGKLEAWLGGEKAAGVYETLTLTPGPSPWESEGGMTLTPALPLSGGGRKEGGVAFLFPGQGSQYPNMLRDLTLHFAEVREAFEMGERTLAGHYERPFGQYIFPPPAFDPETRQRQEAELTATHVAQPALGLASLGALQLLESLGLRPEMVAGHSYGEYVALLAAGAIHTQTLITLSEARGRAMLAVGDELGTMAAAGADAARVQSVLGHLADVWIANLNGPEQTILAGTKEGVALAIALLNEAGIRTRPLNVAAAFHSPIVAQAQAHFAEALQAATYARPQLRLYANTTAALYPDEPEAIRALLVEHLARPVRFMEQIEAMYADGARVFVEVGPRNFLTNLVRQILGQRPHLAVAMDNPGRPGLTQLHHALAQLAVAGLPINLARLYQGRSVRLLNLERLVEETRPAPLSATTWLVNGSSARPHREPPKRYEPLSLPSAHHRDAEIAERTPEEAPRPPHLSGEPQEIQNPKSKIQNEAAPAMLQFQALMGQFLETQRNVMLAYLQGERIHGRGAESAEGVKEETSLQLSHPLPNPPPTRGRERPSPLQGEGSGERVGSSEPPRPPRLSGEAEAIQNPKSKIQNPAALTQLLLEVVSDRTGYPAEALRLDVDVEADLGIDSIKRVEVLGVFLKQALAGRPQLEQQAMSELSGVKTLASIVNWVHDALEEKAEGGRMKDELPSSDFHPSSFILHPSSEVPRLVLVVADAPLPGRRPVTFSPDHTYLITHDGRGIAAQIAGQVQALGGRPIVIQMGQALQRLAANLYQANLANATAVKELLATISQQHGPVGGLFHLLPLAGQMAAEEMTLVAWRSYLGRDVKSLFYLLKEITSLHPSSSTSHPSPFVLAAGSFERYPGQAGLSGLLKTAAKEWPTWRVQCLDLDDSEPADVLAGQIWQEFAADEPSVVVRYHQQQRQVWRPSSVPMDQQTAQLSLDGDSVILLTGGAQGITAEIALELAQHYRPKLILVGRSPLPPAEEDSLTAHLSETKAIKAALFQRAQQSGRPVALAEVERATQRLLKEREMRRVLAELRAAGATVHYYAADVRDEAALHDLLAEVYREYGRLDGIIHGAGVIEDKLIVDKAADSFDRVFDTKADSAFLLSRLVETMGEARPPRFLAFFSSAAGVFGNRGQADYAAANALLNQMAAYLDGRWPGRVVSLAWGPWARTGMVSEELRKQFAAQGMPLVEVAAGRQAFHRELLYGHKGQPEVVYAGGLEAAATWQDGHRNGQVSHALSRPVIHTAAGGQRLPASEDASLHYVGPEVSPNGHRRTNGNGQHPLPLPLLNGHSVHHQGHQVEVSRLLDPQVDRYLLDHQLDGRPVLPAAMALELMAEVVQKGWPDLEVVGVREMQLLRGVILDDDRPRPLRVVATAQAHAPHDRVGANVDVQITAAGHPHLTHYRATVELASHLPLPPRYRLPESLESFPLSAAEAYERWLFHGPLFQAIAGIEGIGPADMVLDIRPSDPQEVLAGPAAGEWLFDPIVVDSGLQAIILWARATMNKTPLVTAVGHFRRYAPFSGRSVKGHLRILNGGANQTLIFNMAFVDGHGRLLGLAEQVTCPYSEALNRLAKQYLVNSIQ